jgi:hypothetical protein
MSRMRPLRRWIWNGGECGDIDGGSVDSQRMERSQASRAGMADCGREGRVRVRVEIVCLGLEFRRDLVDRFVV